jgi:PPK2 family polyphosphate:nucleotide phosphotransferase
MLVKPGTKVSLKDYNARATGSYKAAKQAKKVLQGLQTELGDLQYLLYAENKRTLLVILQGMDASGKDGTIRKVMAAVSPLGVQVKAFKAPSADELAHDFLWRVHQAVPPKGYIGIFNRSHYEDVLIARVHDLVPKKVWQSRYKQINQFERILTQNNVIILKFFLHITKAEQKKRLEERLADASRHWKFDLSDVEERQFWNQYRRAYEDALTLCNTEWAPWHIVPADRTWYRNVVVAETIVEKLRGLDMHFPTPKIELAKVVIK